MLDNDHVQRSTEVRGSQPGGQRSVHGVRLEESVLGLKSISNLLACEDVFLRARDDANVAQPERVDLPLDDVDAVGTFVHEIDFGEDTDRSLALGVDPPCEFQSI